MKRPTILSLGEVLWDLFPDGERFGGAPANFACHAAIQGADVTMLSAVGDDQHGRDGIDILSAYGIDVSLLQIISETPKLPVQQRNCRSVYARCSETFAKTGSTNGPLCSECL